MKHINHLETFQDANPNFIAQQLGMYWLPIADGDPRASAIFSRHYSRFVYGDNRRKNTMNRNRHLIMGPGEYMLLLGCDGRAIFGWRKFIDKSGNTGVNCAVFRNEGALNGQLPSSQLILWAEELAWQRWPNERLYTFVNPRQVASVNPGYCFKMAGWSTCGRTQTRRLLVLEKLPSDYQPVPKEIPPFTSPTATSQPTTIPLPFV